MKDIPIIFSGPMVRALLDGRKTMTRRLAHRPITHQFRGLAEHRGATHTNSPWQKVQPGDRLWVRETHFRYGRWAKDGKTKSGKQRWRFRVASTAKVPDNSSVHYPDNPPESAANRTAMGWHKRPSIFMPRWASRLTLVVTATKVERLQKITNADAIAEGCGVNFDHSNPENTRETFPALRFRDLWAKLHGMESWDANPEVVGLTFAVHEQNIGGLPKSEAA